ncbi:MAG: ribonuclease III [candidate division Zixibacteria bacterium RBG_16_53_22]|nr:MAG: ribonuclease III [candidate division Zixibacteria bacterium RBG_16_53_22]
MAFSFFKRLFSRERSKSLDNFESVLGYVFEDENILAKALSHRSSVSGGLANERLEYLGDAVLGLVVSEFLFKRFPEYNEGNLTKIKAALVNEAMLSKVAGKLNLGHFIYLSSEEEKSGGRLKASIIADAMEAVIGAVYLDGGLAPAAAIVKRVLLEDFENLIKDEAMFNYKGELLERMQGEGRGSPRYEVMEELGPDHIKTFIMSVSVDGIKLGSGQGATKKEAEQKAAKMALESLARMEENAQLEPNE